MRGKAPWSVGRLLATSLAAAGQLSSHVAAYKLDPNSADSIKSVAKDMTADMMSFYNGDQPGKTPGLLPDPYYWWEAGAMMGALVDYWYYTGDTTWNAATTQGLLFQVGPYNDYMPPNQTRTEGNDDQGFWGLAVMSAAEHNYPNPPADQPQWLALAQAVFNTQAARWDEGHCNGGLRWQIFQWNNGFNYKNTISQACFFALAARLARYTGNSSYAEWADRTWDWTVGARFIDNNYYVYDGAHIETNCTNIVPYQWTYNAGGFILGAAAMYNYTESQVWKNRLDGLLKAAEVFFTGNNSDIMTEVACESVKLCNLDQQSFKAYLSRWLAAITKWAPYTTAKVMPWIRASSVAAAAQCKGGSNGRMCGLVWTNENGEWDGLTGVGQQMAAMEIVLANMIKNASAPVQQDTGGTSRGDPGAGGSDIGRTDWNPEYRKLNGGDYFGAAILTLLLVLGLTCTAIFMMMDEAPDKSLKERFSEFRSTLVSGGGAAALLIKRRRPGAGGGVDGAADGTLYAATREKHLSHSGSERSSTREPSRRSFRMLSGGGGGDAAWDGTRGLVDEKGGAGAVMTAAAPTYAPQHWRLSERAGPGGDGGPPAAFPPMGPAPVASTASTSPPVAALADRDRRLSSPRLIGGGETRRKSLRKLQPRESYA